MFKRLAVCAAAAMMLCSCGSSEKHQGSVFAMDTYMSLTAYGSSAEEGIKKASEKLNELDKLWSATESGSEIFAVNSSEGKPVSVSDETASVISFAKEMSSQTGGAFDITVYPIVEAWGFTTGEHSVPSEERLNELLEAVGSDKITVSGSEITLPAGSKLDLGAVAKGRAGDICVDLMKKCGVTSAVLDLGGNIRTLGTKPDGSKWKIGLRDPFSEGIYATLDVGETNIVTSGAYERFFEQDGKTYHHIIEPNTGRPAESGIASATVIGSEGRLCDALSTSLFVLGAEGAEQLYRSSHDFDYILVTDSGEVIMSEGVSGLITFEPGFGEKVSVVK